MKVNRQIALSILSLFCALNLFQHSEFLNLDIQGIHCWRQSQTMWNIRNFVRHDNSIINPRISSFNGGKDNIHRYEFPLMQWVIAQFQRGLGEDIRIVRLSMFLISLMSIWMFALIVYDIFQDWTTAIVSAILFQYGPSIYFYSINPMPDMLALAFSLVYIRYILKHRSSQAFRDLLFASLALLLATLCKLPFLMLSVLSIYFFIKDIRSGKPILDKLKKYALIQIIIVLPALIWYAWVMPGWAGNPILTGKLDEPFVWKESLDILNHHVFIMFPHVLLSKPIWVAIILGFIFFIVDWKQYKWLLSIIGITFIYFFLELKPIGKVHDYYLFPFLFWLYFLVAIGVHKMGKIKYGFIPLLGLCLFSSFYTSKHTSYMWSMKDSYFNTDVMVYSAELKSTVPDDEQCIILNDYTGVFFSYRIDKMGHMFHSDNLPLVWIDDMVKNYGIRYMYSDSRVIDEAEDFLPYVDELLLQKGTVKVLKLKIPDDGEKEGG